MYTDSQMHAHTQTRTVTNTLTNTHIHPLAHKLHSGTVNHIVQYRYCHVLATSVTGTVEATGYSQNQD